MQISNNITAFNVWKNYKGNIEGLQKSMAKLSSGSRISNAGDDASGLAMSERLRTQARNTSAAASNVENKLNYLQTADSWMQKMHDMLGRMAELADGQRWNQIECRPQRATAGICADAGRNYPHHNGA